MNYPDEWKIAVQGLCVRIDYRGQHYHTSAPFRPVRDREGIARPNPNAETLATLWRFAARCYGHPHADDNTPDPPISPEPEPILSAKEQRLIRQPCRLTP